MVRRRHRNDEESREEGRGVKRAAKRANPVMEQLKKDAVNAKQERLRRKNFVQWKELEEGNFLVMDIEHGFSEEVKPEKSRYAYIKWFTHAFKLFDADGNLLRSGKVEADDEDNFYEICSSKRNAKDIEDALDDKFTTAFMTDHELVENWTPPDSSEEISFHKVTLHFGDKKENPHYREILEAKTE